MMFIEEAPLENNLKKIILNSNGTSKDLTATGKLKEANGHNSIGIELDKARRAEHQNLIKSQDKTLENTKSHDLGILEQQSNKENKFVNQSEQIEVGYRKAAGDKEEHINVAAPAAGIFTTSTETESNVKEVNEITISSPERAVDSQRIDKAEVEQKEEEEEEFTLVDVVDVGHEIEDNRNLSNTIFVNIPKRIEAPNEIVVQIEQPDNGHSKLCHKNITKFVTSIGDKSQIHIKNAFGATKAELPPVPDAVPIHECFVFKNKSSNFSKRRSTLKREYRDLTANEIVNEKYHQESEDQRLDWLLKDSQMGFEFINKLRKYLNIGSDSSELTAREDKTRKRRLEECAHSSTVPNLIKYRKVDNHFPKFITHTLEDDINPQAGWSVCQPPFCLQPSSNNLAQNRKIMLMQDKNKSKHQQETQRRRSLFVMPNTMNKLVRNTSYADIEFSDDDDEVIQDNAFKAGSSFANAKSANSRHLNIPVQRTADRSNILTSLNVPSTSSKANAQNVTNGKTVGINATPRPFSSRMITELKPNVFLRENDVFALGERHLNSFISQSVNCNKIGSFDSKNTSIWKTNARSIIQQEREREEREKYKQLLQKVAPCIYSKDRQETSTKNIHNRRSVQADGTSSTQQSKVSSVINLEDSNGEDDTDEVSIIGEFRLPQSIGRSLEAAKKPATVIDVDDSSDEEVNEIVDVDNIISASTVANLKENIGIFDKHDKKKKVSKLPYVAPINSLEDCFNASPHCNDNWLEKFHTKWNENKKLRQRQLEETAIAADKISAERKEAEIRLQERLREFHIVEPDLIVLDDFPEPEVEPEIIPLTQDQQDRIKAAIYGSPDQVLVSKFNMNITRRDIQTLLGNNWLNDEVINFYMNLLIERGEKKHEKHGYPTVYAMNTFFIPRLMQGGHSGVKRWTRKIDIFSKDVIPIPVHVGGVHWCMAIIHLKNKTIKYYDSMGTPNPSVLNALENYLKEESLDKRKQPFDTSKFQIESVKDVPRQMNGSDCGVFSCMFAEYITRNKDITFSQAEMEYFRHKMILEIVQGELLR